MSEQSFYKSYRKRFFCYLGTILFFCFHLVKNIFYLLLKIFNNKPTILMLVDKKGWAYDFSARSLAKQLKNNGYTIDIRYVNQFPWAITKVYDLLYVFFWGEDYYKKFNFDNRRIIKEVSSHRWQYDKEYGQYLPHDFVNKYLRDAATVCCTSERLFNLISRHYPSAVHTPNGFDTELFKNLNQRKKGELIIGWAGNRQDPVKGFEELLLPAIGDNYNFKVADGNLKHSQMNDFYNSIDVFAVTSRHEGEPLTLVEAMAAGCFPVCTDVGIVPELIDDKINGLILKERTQKDLQEAFSWCSLNLEKVRMAGNNNSIKIRDNRSWFQRTQKFKYVFDQTLNLANKPIFRNDDVSADTDLSSFKQFCEIFHKYKLKQIHGVTLFGRTNCIFETNGQPAEYENELSLAHVSNERIRQLSSGFGLITRQDLISYLNEIPDEVALHGLYHTDYSKMSLQEQIDDIKEGLDLLSTIFPNKVVRYFIAPFNRFNHDTVLACKQFNLQLSASEGVQLEAEISTLQIKEKILYRYHHHRFYPQSSFKYYKLSLKVLDEALENSIKK